MSAYNLSDMIRDPKQFIVSEETRGRIADEIRVLEDRIAYLELLYQSGLTEDKYNESSDRW